MKLPTENLQSSAEDNKKEKRLPFKVNCKKATRLQNTSNIYCGKEISHQTALLHLAKKGICASAGSACNAGSPEPSHVITALYIYDNVSPKTYAQSCIRISLSSSNTKQEINLLIQSLLELTSPPLKLEVCNGNKEHKEYSL